MNAPRFTSTRKVAIIAVLAISNAAVWGWVLHGRIGEADETQPVERVVRAGYSTQSDWTHA